MGGRSIIHKLHRNGHRANDFLNLQTIRRQLSGAGTERFDVFECVWTVEM